MSNAVEQDRQYDVVVHRIYNDPRFKEMVAKKQRFSLWLLLLTLGFYILIIIGVAFAPDLVGLPMASDMVTTWGIPAGFFLIIWTILMTGYYVYRTNTYYDPMTEKLLKEIANEIK
ncbi:DUF485 domain-containing protein [Wohlfahrtiimonas chitiniclastica]|uniref:Inner membrane protein yjcH n=2 Tax=Wohlfahrtiimonas chitiniclastica TaxID=400946 RepID=L8Y1D7_9GAMM|nr:DUF485 domain-containing protein [Wohlfahrtiimonas chitiniclastica]ELV08785.1 Inner membrane protein yjcH [Wohlfahrtiimonas chitiniclastica SH04]KZX37971.1 hypothetical protein A6V30_03545 [Wohlfahrtiimonas chitiniclastica]MBS7813956.1 DUF485 domain-containing protein [Wohlfahrtiimonas chitiniclastica]MBS7816219.1 DUF485 domain-containing protein [Wohlfahrtiimonas chitiniclastica]MBS7817852.1 DUF485 domain-containing protein [Wohlfahrtiimonas chitiniclastica]